MIYTRRQKAMASATFLAAVWIVAAAAQPDSTYHLAPLLVAGSVPVMARSTGWTSRAVEATVGAALATAISGGLAAIGWMNGPTLLPYGGPLAESLTLVVVGSVAGVFLGGIGALGDQPTAAV